MIQEITVKRTLPVNLKSGDEALFKPSLEVTFQRPSPIQVNDCWILEDTVFDPKSLNFLASRTHNANLGPVQFAKRIVLSIPKKWRKIPKGIWEGKELAPDSPILLPQSFEKLRYVTDSLKLAGLEVIFFAKNENLKISELTLTARTATFPNFFEPLAKKTRERLSLHPVQAPWKKVYISRKLAPKRKAHNEQEVENFL